ncbi:MAG TPA: NUDIX domain-containing protein [Phycisphaerales bacterium]|nr:NUDIX domain-containing protein [Phycisphaerales bacterium]
MTTPPPGYQPHTPNGAKIRADVIDVYVFTRIPASDPLERASRPARLDGEAVWNEPRSLAPAVYFLQLLRSGPPLGNTWHPVMGHVHAGESSLACARRELHEELGLGAGDPAILGLWALEQVHPFYIAAIDTIVMSPRFACEVRHGWVPRLNDEHTRHRWVRHSDAHRLFMWPGQKACCREIIDEIIDDRSLGRDLLRIDPSSVR